MRCNVGSTCINNIIDYEVNRRFVRVLQDGIFRGPSVFSGVR